MQTNTNGRIVGEIFPVSYIYLCTLCAKELCHGRLADFAQALKTAQLSFTFICTNHRKRCNHSSPNLIG